MENILFRFSKKTGHHQPLILNLRLSLRNMISRHWPHAPISRWGHLARSPVGMLLTWGIVIGSARGKTGPLRAVSES